MKKSIVLLSAFVALAFTSSLTFASSFADDKSITFEIGMGFGKSGNKTEGSDAARFCKNRNHGRMMFGAIRVRGDNVEVHTAHWWGDNGDAPNCDRDSWAVGLGYVLSTEDNGTSGQDNMHLSWTPGVAYTWGEDKNFRGKDKENTNWRLTGNWQMFNRLAVGGGSEDLDIEVAVHRYGTFNPEHGEYFVSVGLALKDLENTDSDSNGNGGHVHDHDAHVNNKPHVHNHDGDAPHKDNHDPLNHPKPHVDNHDPLNHPKPHVDNHDNHHNVHKHNHDPKGHKNNNKHDDDHKGKSHKYKGGKHNDHDNDDDDDDDDDDD